ncbi:MAG: hypothetical protein COU40_02230 [Candidatus Moranbacteria bacterium CG10_big_fil_rev_8_21_14_0_10_35_21]|nr:MAG: hypothetical protein COU40_02230 [Candidatus Moranbacteria bacterium CG10_big_fil_rev_8_21_14_0_10_35_21]PJA88812.1 MAG: hypothetical protein CO139_01085 [Candidatus Moranbacteria bacterium CG_4_9_14_3_um_filter_36_9]
MNTLFYCNSAACHFDKTPAASIIFFEFFIFVGVLLSLYFLSKIEKRILLKFLTVAVGIFIFESFTHPLWVNAHLGSWAYMYRDVSWVLTIGWTALVLVPVSVIDKFYGRLEEWKRFIMYLFSITFLGVLGETAVVNLGIRSYAPETIELISGRYISLLNIPWDALYYTPVFMALVVGFYKYWELVINKDLVAPVKKVKWLKTLLITALGVLLFEIMIEPMVINAGLPSWSYIYRDVSFLMTGGWILIIWLAVILVNKVFIQFNLVEKFLGYIAVATIITMPIESWLIVSGIRQYGPSATGNFSGYHIPLTNVPVEIAFAIPFYLALIIAFVSYWVFQFNRKKQIS